MTRLQDRVQRVGIRFPFCNATTPLVNQMGFYRLDDKDIEQDYNATKALLIELGLATSK